MPGRGRLTVAAVVAAVVALQLGAFSVVVQTVLSGVAALPFSSFLLFMQPIHLAIGVVEGLVTAAVLLFVRRARPELLAVPSACSFSLKPVVVAFFITALLTGGLVSWFVSGQPDGLEWSIAKASGLKELHGPDKGMHLRLSDIQQKTALLPGYAFNRQKKGEMVHGAERSDTSLAGIFGGSVTLLTVLATGFLTSRRKVALKGTDAFR